MSNIELEDIDDTVNRAHHSSWWVRVNYQIVSLCGKLSAFLFVLIAALITYEVIARYIFLAPTIWSADISLLCQIWATCLGASWVLQHKALIRIDILNARLGPRLSRVTECISLLSIALFSAVCSYYGYLLLHESIAQGSASASMLGLPSWTTESAIPCGFGLLTIQAITEFFLVLSGEQQHKEGVSA